MPLFRTKYDKSKTQKVVTFIPESVTLYLNLHCLAHGHTRTQAVRELVEAWYRRTYEDMPEEVLIDKIIDTAEKQWEIAQSVSKTKAQYENFDDFLDQLENELSNEYRKKRNLPLLDPTICKTVISRLDEKNKR